MITYRTLFPSQYWNNAETKEKIDVYLKPDNLAIPENAILIFLAEDGGKIVGVSCIARLTVLEPLKSDLPFAGYVLSNQALGVAPLYDNYSVRAITGNENVIEQCKKYGFKVEKENVTVLRKEI